MNQPTADLEFDAIVAGFEAFPAAPGRGRMAGEPDIQRIASAVFCSSTINPAVVAFAVRRSAAHRGLPEDEIDVAVTVAVLANAVRVMHDLHPLDPR